MNIKFYTDIEQSKKLLSLGLHPDTADMYYPEYDLTYSEYPEIIGSSNEYYSESDIPAWSLNALLRLMPKLESKDDEISEITGAKIIVSPFIGKNMCCYINDTGQIHIRKDSDSSINAAFEMICYLIENKILNLEKK